MNDGFFDLLRPDEVEVVTKNCYSCNLFLYCNSPKMTPTGQGKKKILILGSAPGGREDEKGKLFIGGTGQYLNSILKDMGLNLRNDFWVSHAINCYPLGGRDPKKFEIEACRNRLLDFIQKEFPKVIVTLGKVPFASIIGDRATKSRLKIGKVSDWVGEVIPDQDLKCWIIPTYDLTFVHQEENPFFLRRLKESIQSAVEAAESSFYIANIKDDIHITKSEKQAIRWLETQAKSGLIAWDKETTGKKPWRKGHAIKTVAFSNGMNAFAFPWFDSLEFQTAWNKVICGPTKLIAHNAQFEAIWNYAITGRWPTQFRWCTMTGAHCLHNKKPTGLKYLSYAHHGVIGYDSGVDEYITKPRNKSEEAMGANAFNNIDAANLGDVLFYNGVDAHITYREYEYQLPRLQGMRRKGNNFFLMAGDSFAKMHANGMRVNVDLMEKESKTLTRKIRIQEEKLFESDEVKKWDGEFNINSNTQLNKLLYGVLGYKKPKEGPQTDKSALEKIGTPFIKQLLSYKKNYKLLNTYIGQFNREQTGGIIHSFFNLSGAASYKDEGGKTGTYRSSSGSPNFQNNPKRDAKQMNVIRSLIVPRNGRKLIEYDNKGNEVKAAACITQDKNLIAHELDDSLDMHRDCAARLFLLNKEEVDKKRHRHPSKNGFVFPEFYGSSWRNVAGNLWEMTDQATKLHLKKKGIGTFSKWQKHVAEVEEYLWSRFAGYARWKKRVYKQYEKDGYIDLVTGFRCWGPMGYTDATNYLIQGPAFHIMLWALIQIMDVLRKNRMETLCCGQIHDSMFFDVVPDEEEELDRIVYQYGVEEVSNYWDWITIPPVIEKEASEVDGNWAHMIDCGYLKKV